MTIQKPFHTTPDGGSIVCLQGLTGRIFRACSLNKCTYTADLHSAKFYLDCLENKKVKFLPSPRNNFFPHQEIKNAFQFSEKQLLNGMLTEVSHQLIWLEF